MKLKQILPLFAITLFLIIIIKRIKLDIIIELISHWEIFTLLIISSTIYILIKSLSIFLLSEKFKLNESFKESIKIFCMSSFFEVITFFGKIAGDGFKFMHWNRLSKKKRTQIILFLRTTDISAFIVLTLGVYFKIIDSIIIIIILITVLIIIFNKLNKKKTYWVKMFLISMVSFSIISLQFLIAYSTFGLETNFDNFNIFLISHGAGVISNIPLGLGVKDFSIFYQLKELLTTQQIIMGIIWVRILGELFSASLGAFFYLSYKKEK